MKKFAFASGAEHWSAPVGQKATNMGANFACATCNQLLQALSNQSFVAALSMTHAVRCFDIDFSSFGRRPLVRST